MYEFRYHRARSIDDAIDQLRAGGDVKLLAGGQTLLASLKLRMAQPDVLVDIGALEDLRGIDVDPDVIAIGAATRHAEVAEAPEVQAAIPALAHLASHIGDPMIRNVGTLGGSLANNDPAADYPAAVLGLNATVITTEREIAADDFFLGLFETALRPGEMIVAVAFPRPRRAAYVKFKHPASRFALVGVWVAETHEGVRVAVTGAGPCVFRLSAAETALQRHFDAAALDDLVVPPTGLNSDLHASAAYRAHLVQVVARRAVAQAQA